MQNGKPHHQSDLNSQTQQLAMTFSAVMRSLQGSLNTENVIPTCTKVWEWVKATFAEATLGLPKDVEHQESRPSDASTGNPGTPEVMEGQGRITDKQRKRLYAIAREANLSMDDLKAKLKQHYGIDSTYKIPWQQYDEICTAVEENTWPF